MDGTGLVSVNHVSTGVYFAGNLFGYYIKTPYYTWYSDPALNADDSAQHMVAFQGKGDNIQIPGLFSGLWTPNEYALAWEDLPNSQWDYDYQDLGVMVESVHPIPEPTSLILLGSGFLGIAVAIQRRKK